MQKKTALWTEVITDLKRIGVNNDGPSFWLLEGSFFWKQLHKLLPLFRQSTQWVIADGKRISFWYDAWGEEPLCLTRTPDQYGLESLYETLPQLCSNCPQIWLRQYKALISHREKMLYCGSGT